MKLTVLGCTGSMSGPKGAASSYLLQAWGASSTCESSFTSGASNYDQMGTKNQRLWTLVLEMGPGAMGRLLANMSPWEVDALLLSHCHADHMVDVIGMQVYRRWGPGSPRNPLDFYGPSNTLERVRGVGGDGRDEDFATEFNFHTYEVGKTYKIGPFTLQVFSALHPVEAYSLRITGPRGFKPLSGSTLDSTQLSASNTSNLDTSTFAFSGDSDICPGIEAACANADLFLCEAAFKEGRDIVRGVHLTGYRAGKIAAQQDVNELVLTHLQPWTDPDETIADARQHYNGLLCIAEPGREFVF